MRFRPSRSRVRAASGIPSGIGETGYHTTLRRSSPKFKSWMSVHILAGKRKYKTKWRIRLVGPGYRPLTAETGIRIFYALPRNTSSKLCFINSRSSIGLGVLVFAQASCVRLAGGGRLHSSMVEHFVGIEETPGRYRVEPPFTLLLAVELLYVLDMRMK